MDTHIQQKFDAPALNLQMDRTRLQQLNLTASNVAQNVLISLSGSSQTSPGFWFNNKNGVEYSVAVQTPQYQVSSIDELLRTPVSGSANGPTQLLGNLVQVTPKNQFAVVTHYNIRPVIDVFVSVEGRDLGSIAKEVDTLVDQSRASLPRGSQIIVRGQVATMRSSFLGLGVGVAMAIV
ncbi:MAG: hypothetical protein QOD67_1348, partial [Caballeronia sp.]|nr:hypothetical protein [Caballeronia sp.]